MLPVVIRLRDASYIYRSLPLTYGCNVTDSKSTSQSQLSSCQTGSQPVVAQSLPWSVASSWLLAGTNRLDIATMVLSLVNKLKVIFVVGVVLSSFNSFATC